MPVHSAGEQSAISVSACRVRIDFPSSDCRQYDEIRNADGDNGDLESNDISGQYWNAAWSAVCCSGVVQKTEEYKEINIAGADAGNKAEGKNVLNRRHIGAILAALSTFIIQLIFNSLVIGGPCRAVDYGGYGLL